jgi:MoaA/NifB/PqqE/SkfB family radical SAM enzyme
MPNQITDYLEDPFLRRLYDLVKTAGPMRPSQIDITHSCNIRCEGCYFFSEELDQFQAPKDEATFDDFIAQEKARGTNFLTVVGGEPSLMLNRLKKVYDNFKLIVVTNGIRRIPTEGFENMPIAVSVWGDHETDTRLRGNGKLDVFAKGLKNYKDDPRAIWYFTANPGHVHEIESVVSQIVDNGNYMGFNFYGDIANHGGDLDHRQGFERVRREIDRMIERYPERVIITSYMNQVITTRKLYDDDWGFSVCATLSDNIEKNRKRFENGNPYLPHYRVYNPDLKTTRGCCRSDKWDCENCYDTWANISWIIVNVEKHLGSVQEFTHWLTSVFIFHLTGRTINFEEGIPLLPEVHHRLRHLREQAPALVTSPLAPLEDLVYQVL